VRGIRINEDAITENLRNSLMLVTALNPHIGYDKAAKVAKEAFNTGCTLRDAVQRLGFMSGSDFDTAVNPKAMANL
jgi:fumarate hydratase class II